MYSLAILGSTLIIMKHYSLGYLKKWIINDGLDRLVFYDYSVPKDDPLNTDRSGFDLQRKIYDRITKSHVVVIPTGMYANCSKWIEREIMGAKLYERPILAVNFRGQERKSGVVLSNSDDFAGWSSKTVVGKIWSLYAK
jgi:hypothetical protein